MTCIVGLRDRDGTIYMGGDSLSAGGNWDCMNRLDQKVFRTGDFLIGFTSSYRMGQLLRYKLKPPEHPEGMDTVEYMVAHWIEAARECLKVGGYTSVNSNREEGGVFLVGYRDRLFEVNSDFQVGENADGLAACGCGFAYALGAMHANDYMPAQKRIEQALQAAERFSAGVRGPFVIEKL